MSRIFYQIVKLCTICTSWNLELQTITEKIEPKIMYCSSYEVWKFAISYFGV